MGTPSPESSPSDPDCTFSFVLFSDRNQSLEEFAKVADQNNGNSFPDLHFHCGDGWVQGASRRLTAVHSRPYSLMGCDDETNAVTTWITSGTFPPDASSEFGPEGAFRSGVHVTLCPNLFKAPSLGNIEPVAEGSRLRNRYDNQARYMLHEMMHAADRRIKGICFILFITAFLSLSPSTFYLAMTTPCVRSPILSPPLLTNYHLLCFVDGAFGYQRCVELTQGLRQPGRDDVRALDNADTYAIFAMGEYYSKCPLPVVNHGYLGVGSVNALCYE
jgi:hypothetical protein